MRRFLRLTEEDMPFSERGLMESMTPQQRLMFEGQYLRTAKSRTVGLLLTLFLGGLGAHRFYLGQIRFGILYVVFVWTLIPALISLVELFLIGGRVDRYNENHARELAERVRLHGAAA